MHPARATQAAEAHKNAFILYPLAIPICLGTLSIEELARAEWKVKQLGAGKSDQQDAGDHTERCKQHEESREAEHRYESKSEPGHYQ